MCSYFETTFVNKNSIVIEKNMKQLIKGAYFAARPRIIFTSMSLVKPGGKDLVPKFKKSMLVYQYDCFCKATYIGMTSRQLIKRVKEHVPKSVESYCNSEEKERKSTQVLNALKRSSIAEHLVNHPNCANNYNRNRFKIIKSCNNVFELMKLEAICILLRKPTLCKHKEFDYTVTLFT